MQKADFLESISPSVMIPEHRLATLLDQVKQGQVARCHYHNPLFMPSLFVDHLCDRSQFPLETAHEITQESEVWFLAFSHDGSRLATSGEANYVTIYATASFQKLHVLHEHTAHVAYVAWSPDDTRLITCSHDRSAKVWDVIVSGTLRSTYST